MLRLLIDSTPYPVSYLDLDLCYQFNNAAYEEWFGHAPREIRGKHVREVLGVEAFETVREHMEAALSGLRVSYRAHVPCSDTGIRQVRVTLIPHRRDRAVAGLMVYVVDTSETGQPYDALEGATHELEQRVRQRTGELEQAIATLKAEIAEHRRDEETLATRENQLRSVLNNMVDGIVTADEHGTISAFNAAAESIFGYTTEEVMGRNLNVLMPEPYHHEHDRYLANYLDTGEKKIIGIGREVTAQRKDGSIFPVDLAVSEFWIGPKRMFTGIIRDITKRKQAEQELQESQRSLSTLFSNLPGMVYRCRNDREWTLEFVSEGCRELTGYEPSDLLENARVSMGRLIHPADRDAVWNTVQDALSKREPFEATYRISTAEGQERWLWERGRGIFAADGELEAIEGFASDLSERRLLEDQLRQAQKMESIGQLAGGIAHDFNNQLGIILFDVDLLISDAPKESQLNQDLHKIRRVVLRAADLTRQLLVFSRRQQMARRPLSLNDEIREQQKMLSRLLGENIEVRLDLADGLFSVNADPANIDQVIINLCVNARDAMPEGGTLAIETSNVTVSEEYCRQRTQASPGSYCRLVVSDTGSGMDDQVQSRIFEPFFTTKETGKGTGLGLSVVYGIVEAHEGWITVESEAGEGTRFEMFLPALAREDARELPGIRATESDRNPGSGGSVLLIEDERELRDRTVRLLRDSGYEVIAVPTASEGRDAFLRERCDLLLTDVVLPDGRGTELAAEFLQQSPDLEVIFMTGYADVSIDLKGSAENPPVLYKPFSISDLLRCVRNVLDGSRP